ncbi:MAG: hypothetical protein AB2L21_10840 [Anaerolineaceae bacterium]
MIGFAMKLREAGIPVSVKYILELHRALRQGMASDLDQLFLLTRLIFVKRVEYYDLFEQVFMSFFLGVEGNRMTADWQNLLEAKPFREWLEKEIKNGRISEETAAQMDTEELLKRFWETLLKQQAAHHGGGKWVGTGGVSPYGHGGWHPGGIRVYGQSHHGTASKVLDTRRYINYSDQATLSTENLRQVLTSLKSLRPVGPEDDLNIEETIARTARNAGEIELVFQRELRNRMKLIVLVDNGGYSMDPHIPLVKTLFNKLRDLFRDIDYYYFHNCIYGTVYKDPERRVPMKWEKFISEPKSTRLVIIGDANMAPSELMAQYGAISIYANEPRPGIEWLKELRNAFPVSVWFNPIEKYMGGYHSFTINQIAQIFHMEDLTLAGIKDAVAYLNIQGQTFDKM